MSIILSPYFYEHNFIMIILMGFNWYMNRSQLPSTLLSAHSCNQHFKVPTVISTLHKETMPHIFGIISHIFGTMAHIFGTMPHIFSTMLHIFGTMQHIFGTMPHIFGTMPDIYHDNFITIVLLQ